MDVEKICQAELNEDLVEMASVKTEDMMDTVSDHDPLKLKAEEEYWEKTELSEDHIKFEDSQYLKDCRSGESTNSESNLVIRENDVDQLVREREDIIKMAYNVCCMFMHKNFDSDHESADSGISEQDVDKTEQIPVPCVDQLLPEVNSRKTRSQSRAQNLKLQESKTKAQCAETMEAFLTLNTNFLSKAVLEAVKGTEVGDMLNELESQKDENLQLEKYILELEKRRDALKLCNANTQNLIFQRRHAAQRVAAADL